MRKGPSHYREQHRHYGDNTMSPNEYNRALLGGFRASVQGFIVGELDLDEIQ